MQRASERIQPMAVAGNPQFHGLAVQLVGDMLKSFGYRDPASMADLFLQVIKSSKANAEEIAFQRVRMRSQGAEEKLLAEEGGVLSDAEFAEKLGVRSRSTIQNYREQNKIFAVPRGARNLCYPAWQICKKDLLPGLAETLGALAGARPDPLGIALFFLTPAEALDDERPLDLLRRNEVDAVVGQARHHGRRE
jgi:hypothetical protein